MRKGYQETDGAPHAAVVTKLKGAAVAEAGGAGRRLWDAADYGRPPQVRPALSPPPRGEREGGRGLAKSCGKTPWERKGDVSVVNYKAQKKKRIGVVMLLRSVRV